MPPLCLFPEAKDTEGIDRRENLITVPSCDEHNLAKSKDDEFLMACVTPVIGNNGTAYLQTQTKLSRAVRHTEGRLLDAIMSEAKPSKLVASDGSQFPVLIGRADMPRLCRVLEHVARGLYFHARGGRFIGTCHIMPDFIQFAGDPDVELLKRLIQPMDSQERVGWFGQGANPDIFHFEIGPTDQHDLIPMIMTFFRGAKVFVAFQPEGVRTTFRTLGQATAEDPIVIDLYVDTDGVELG